MKFRIAAAFLLLTGCFAKNVPLGNGDPEYGVDITWHGHSCFTLRDSLARLIVIDPFDETVGYKSLQLRADAVLVTHAHFDHNHLKVVKSNRSQMDVRRSTGSFMVAGDIAVKGIFTPHDDEAGLIHGDNRTYIFEMAGLRIAHMGDIGQKKLTPKQRGDLGALDILFIPVGGVTTITPEEAKAYVDQLRPKVVFPMHYGDIRFYKLRDVTDFTRLFPSDQVKQLKVSDIRIRKKELSATPKIIVLNPVHTNY